MTGIEGGDKLKHNCRTMFHNGIELLRTVSASSSSSSSSSIDDVVSSSTNKTPSEITIDDIDQLCDDKNHIKEVQIEQFAQRVLEFSSQYGSDYSISYTACNITGRPSKFPNYGDFPETFAMVSDGERRSILSSGRILMFRLKFTANVWQLVGYSAIAIHRNYAANYTREFIAGFYW